MLETENSRRLPGREGLEEQFLPLLRVNDPELDRETGLLQILLNGLLDLVRARELGKHANQVDRSIGGNSVRLRRRQERLGLFDVEGRLFLTLAATSEFLDSLAM